MTTQSTMRTKNAEKSVRKIFRITFRRQIPGVNIKGTFGADIDGDKLNHLFCILGQILQRFFPNRRFI